MPHLTNIDPAPLLLYAGSVPMNVRPGEACTPFHGKKIKVTKVLLEKEILTVYRVNCEKVETNG